MELDNQDTDQLENILADEIVGTNPSIKSPIFDEKDEHKKDDNIKRFITWMFIYDDSKKKFREEHTLIWHSMRENGNYVDWLVYYKGVLLKEIRDIRLKKLL